MKLRWKVSIQAIIRRAYDLGLFDAAQYRRANIHISKSGQRKNEPGEPDVMEQPELLKLSLVKLEEFFKIDPTTLAYELGLKPRFFWKS
ncbi:hypothetical protein [Candidatus Vondammii sp. HM_W22]|uniref:hypothetical protein n=1 Tax=Candidatus Vondammii sp. HM_W22 TaxID=2687299 RepID=UPI001F132FC9|nr:hypothetical protein [Candidatus Vondammii sp. HM_W22]